MTWRGPWIIFGVYWALSALKTRRTQRKESFASRYGILLLEVAGFALLFMDEAEIGILGHRVIPRSHAHVVTAVTLTWAGIALAHGRVGTWDVLERTHHDQRRSQADPHRTLRASSPSHLFWD